jgi:hypothetical protein
MTNFSNRLASQADGGNPLKLANANQWTTISTAAVERKKIIRNRTKSTDLGIASFRIASPGLRVSVIWLTLSCSAREGG